MNTDNLNTTVTTEQEIVLYKDDFVFMDENGDFVRFPDGEIMIMTDEDELREEIECGSTPISCTELSEEKQAELIENIKKFNG